MATETRTSVNGKSPQAWGAETDETPHVGGRRLAVIMVSVLLGILLAALDQTVVGPALPKIIGDLNGFDHYAWVVTIYLLTSTISVPIFGKLSDMYGRKWFYVAGIAIFLIGSALSGLSSGREAFSLLGFHISGLTTGMAELIAFRGLQGLGAGILFASAFAIIADLIPPRDRGKWQGAFGGVWGLASVLGPNIGGYLTDNWGWQWVFYVNVPVGLVALVVLVATFPHEVPHHVRKIVDWMGAITLTASLTPLLLALSLGSDWGWGSTTTVSMFAAAAIFMIAFLVTESRAKEPIIPLSLFKNRIFTVSMITVFVTGAGLFGAVLYVPLFIQAIQGDSASSSGNALTPMMLSVVAASALSGQLLSRTGRYRVLGVVGMTLVTIGMFLLFTMDMNTSRLTTIAYMVVLGLGMGVTFPLYTLVVQNAFPIQQVGVVTAAVQFFRSIGSTIGVAVLGSFVNSQYHNHFPTEYLARTDLLGIPRQFAQQLLSGISGLNPQALVGSEGLARLHTQLVQFVPAQFSSFIPKIEGAITDAMKPALFGGIQQAFLIGAVLLALGLVATVFLKEIPLRKSNQRPAAAMAEGGIGALEPVAEEAGKEFAASGMPGGSSLPARDEPQLVER